MQGAFSDIQVTMISELISEKLTTDFLQLNSDAKQVMNVNIILGQRKYSLKNN